jgi:hypothetical protein
MHDVIALLREAGLRLIRVIDADPPMPPFPLAIAAGQYLGIDHETIWPETD